MTTGPDRFFFVHVQKTAGTTLRQRLASTLGEAALYPSEVDGGATGLTFVVEEMQHRVAARADELIGVFGHFPLCSQSLLPWPVRTITLLREPVERTLSYLRHHRETTPDDAALRLEEIYDDPLRFHGMAHNHATKMLSLTVDEMTDGMLTRVDFTAGRLARVKAAVETIDVVGLSEDFEEFCHALCQEFGWPLPDRPSFANRSTPVDVSAAFRARIAEDNRADIELYDFAAKLVARRAAMGTTQGASPRG